MGGNLTGLKDVLSGRPSTQPRWGWKQQWPLADGLARPEMASLARSRGRRSQTVGADCLTVCHPRDQEIHRVLEAAMASR